MTNKDIDTLLEKYFEGETSIYEERILIDYFKQPEATIDDQHKPYIALFAYLKEEKEELLQTKNKSKGKKARLKALPLWVSVAAMVALVFVALMLTNKEGAIQDKSFVYRDGVKISNEEVIRAEAFKSLMQIENMEEDISDSQIDILDSFIND